MTDLVLSATAECMSSFEAFQTGMKERFPGYFGVIQRDEANLPAESRPDVVNQWKAMRDSISDLMT